QRRRPARRGRLSRPAGGRRALLGEARELRREHGRGHHGRRDRADGGGQAPGAPALRRRARARGPAPGRHRRSGAVRVKTAAAVALRAVPRAALALPPAWRRRLTVLGAVLVALACTYVFWFRDSSFVSVQKVEVTGVAGPQARAIRTALTDAGLDMTTLHVRLGDLRRAVADFPVVRAVSAQGRFPHVLRVQVELNLPVA